jgi:biopolymer transport protein ExbD
MPRRRRRRSLPIPTASMGDIAMLLIIFFMVCSNFAKNAGVNLKPPTSVDIDKMKESATWVSIDNIGKYRVNGAEVPDAKSIKVAVECLIGKRTNAEARMVVFQCDAAIDKKTFEPVIEAISEAGGTVAAMGEKRRR